MDYECANFAAILRTNGYTHGSTHGYTNRSTNGYTNCSTNKNTYNAYPIAIPKCITSTRKRCDHDYCGHRHC